MFTGIVERTAVMREILETGGGRRMTVVIDASSSRSLELPLWRAVDLGESIAVNGACLTAVAARTLPGGGEVSFEAVPETLGLTTLGRLKTGEFVNLERSLRVGDSFGGHYVTGHIDGVGHVLSIDVQGDQSLFRISCAAALLRQILKKGSIAVDGISLTVVDVDRGAGWFSFAAIPHTLERTTLGRAGAGTPINLETDAFGKWVLHACEISDLNAGSSDVDRSSLGAMLESAGFGRVSGADESAGTGATEDG